MLAAQDGQLVAQDQDLDLVGVRRPPAEHHQPWLLANRHLTIRYERRADILTAFLHLACALICARRLQPL